MVGIKVSVYSTFDWFEHEYETLYNRQQWVGVCQSQ